MCDSPLSSPSTYSHKKAFYSKTSHRTKVIFQTCRREPSSPMDIPIEDSNASEDSTTEGSTGVATKRTKSAGNQPGKKKRDKSKRAVSWRHSSRSRRLIANARERSRIHIMSEAFDCLRRAVPCYSHDQKLSKLAILRLATSYISALAHLNHLYEHESDKSLKLFADCVDECTRALQTEGRTRRKEWVKISLFSMRKKYRFQNFPRDLCYVLLPPNII